jgi:hyperosmotically inducible protein
MVERWGTVTSSLISDYYKRSYKLRFTMKSAAILLSLALTLPLLSGCLAVAVGGAAAGGYMLGTDELTVGQIADDSAITAAIKAKLFTARDIKSLDINVDTYNQVVTLRGQVYSAAQKSQALQIASEAKGVTSVTSELRIKNVTTEDR